MRRTVSLILAIVALVASSCGQSDRRPVAGVHLIPPAVSWAPSPVGPTPHDETKMGLAGDWQRAGAQLAEARQAEMDRQARARATAQRAGRSAPAGRPTTARPTISPAALLRSIGGCESSGDKRGPLVFTADNKSPTSTASGAYGITDSTWNGKPGKNNGWKYAYGYGTSAASVSRALHADPDTQTLVASRALAAQGTTPWAASRGCWG